MERKEIIEVLNDLYNPLMAMEDDCNGLQVEGKEEVSKVMTTLDLTLDVISQAIENSVDMIITHHPLFFGNKEEILLNSKTHQMKYELLKKQNINVFVVHTPADFAPHSLAFSMAEAIDLNDIEQLENNIGIVSKNNELIVNEVVDRLRNSLSLDYSFNTNVELSTTFEDIVITSGAGGAILFEDVCIGKLVITGEVKHHEWVYANENGISLLEIGHYSEYIFKEMVKISLEDELEIEIITAIEQNGYKQV